VGGKGKASFTKRDHYLYSQELLKAHPQSKLEKEILKNLPVQYKAAQLEEIKEVFHFSFQNDRIAF
jgi:hypothetical protein